TKKSNSELLPDDIPFDIGENIIRNNKKVPSPNRATLANIFYSAWMAKSHGLSLTDISRIMLDDIDHVPNYFYRNLVKRGRSPLRLESLIVAQKTKPTLYKLDPNYSKV